jgi:hypothetical protein
MGESRMVLWTEVIGSERFSFMRSQFQSVFTYAPFPDSIRVIHTDHAMKMNQQLRTLYRICMNIRKEKHPQEQPKLDYLPGMYILHHFAVLFLR